MVTDRARNVLAFLKKNVENEVETMKEARRFVRGLQELTEGERLFLDCALKDMGSMAQFEAAISKRTIGS